MTKNFLLQELTKLYSTWQNFTKHYRTLQQVYIMLHKSKKLYKQYKTWQHFTTLFTKLFKSLQNITKHHKTLQNLTKHTNFSNIYKIVQHCTQLYTTLHNSIKLYKHVQTLHNLITFYTTNQTYKLYKKKPSQLYTILQKMYTRCTQLNTHLHTYTKLLQT